MNIHVLQHEWHEGVACIYEWIVRNQHFLSTTNFRRDDNLPDLDSIDMLLIMGGSMSVNDDDKFTWLTEEKALIKSAIESGKKVLGICLGSQLVSNALGSKVYPNKYKEIGWFPLMKTSIADDEGFEFLPDNFISMHWHGETFDLPEGARLISSSEATSNQIYKYKNNVLAIQCHFEFTSEIIELMVEKGADELVPDKFVQTSEEIRINLNQAKENNKIMMKIMDEFVKS